MLNTVEYIRRAGDVEFLHNLSAFNKFNLITGSDLNNNFNFAGVF